MSQTLVVYCGHCGFINCEPKYGINVRIEFTLKIVHEQMAKFRTIGTSLWD